MLVEAKFATVDPHNNSNSWDHCLFRVLVNARNEWSFNLMHLFGVVKIWIEGVRISENPLYYALHNALFQ